MDDSLRVLGTLVLLKGRKSFGEGPSRRPAGDLEPRSSSTRPLHGSPYRKSLPLSLPGNPISFVECDGRAALREGGRHRLPILVSRRPPRARPPHRDSFTSVPEPGSVIQGGYSVAYRQPRKHYKALGN